MSNPALPSFERLDTINRLAVVARLLSSAVHDTRNALQIVTGHAELFAESAADVAKARERSRAILVQSERATQRMHGLVVMAQGGESAPSRFELRAMVEEVVGLRRSSFGRARIKVTIAPADREFWVRASRADLIRVVANLMLNAERAVSGRAGAEIVFTVSLEGDRARLTVQDNGPGIDPAIQSSLFEPFGAGSDTTPGLGLYVSKALAERAGGTLRWPGNEGGARLVLDLPLAS